MSTANVHHLVRPLPVAAPLPPVRQTSALDFLNEELPARRPVKARIAYKREKTSSHSEFPLGLIVFSCLAMLVAIIFSWPGRECKNGYIYEDNNPMNAWWSGPSKTGYPWHEKVSSPVAHRPTSNPIEVMVLDQVKGVSRSRLVFSPNKFMSSVSGWVIISGAIVILCSISMMLRGGGRKRRI